MSMLVWCLRAKAVTMALGTTNHAEALHCALKKASLYIYIYTLYSQVNIYIYSGIDLSSPEDRWGAPFLLA